MIASDTWYFALGERLILARQIKEDSLCLVLWSILHHALNCPCLNALPGFTSTNNNSRSDWPISAHRCLAHTIQAAAMLGPIGRPTPWSEFMFSNNSNNTKVVSHSILGRSTSSSSSIHWPRRSLWYTRLLQPTPSSNESSPELSPGGR